MPNYTVEALVIRRHNFAEKDRLLTLISPNKGKIRALAKGVRRPGSQIAGHVELFAHSKVFLAEGRNLDIVTQATTLNASPEFGHDLDRLSQAFYLAELVDAVTHEGEENYGLFNLVRGVLQSLPLAKSPTLAVRYFEYQLVRSMGYEHPMAGLPAAVGEARASYGAATGRRPSAVCLEWIAQLDRGSWPDVLRADPDPGALDEIGLYTYAMLEQVCDKQLKASNFIRQVKRLA